MPEHDRLEREIEEILGKIDQFPDEGSRARRARARRTRAFTDRVAGTQRDVARRLSGISVSQLMLFSFLMILGAFFFRGRLLPPSVASLVLLAGAVLFISCFAVMVFTRGRGGSRNVEQTWRGRTVRYNTGPTMSQRLRRWWMGRSRR